MGTSAYSKITAHITSHIKNQGYPTTIAANWGHEGAILEWEGIKIYPRIGIGMSELWGVEAAKDFGADIMITLYDVWALQSLAQHARGANLPVCFYAMFDHADISLPLHERLKESFETISPTKYGEALCRKAGYQNVTHIPFGVDTDLYKPSDKPKKELRKPLGFGEDIDFLIGFIAMTRLRKGLPYGLEAVKLFMESNPDIKCGIYLHGLAQEEYDLTRVMDAITVTKHSRFPQQFKYHLGWDEEQVVAAYQAFDVLVDPCFGGGFELPVIEAHAVGTPVVCSDHTSFTELVKPVTPELLVPPKGKIWAEAIPARLYLPDVEKMADALEKVLNSGAESYRDKLRENALQYDWKQKILPRWPPFLDYLATRMEESCMKLPPPSELLKAQAKERIIIE